MQKYLDGISGGKKTRLGEMFFEEFKDHFWEKPHKHHIYKYYMFIFQSH